MQHYPVRPPPQGQYARPPTTPPTQFHSQVRPPPSSNVVRPPRPPPQSPDNAMQNRMENMSLHSNSPGPKGARARRVFHPDGLSSGSPVRPPVARPGMVSPIAQGPPNIPRPDMNSAQTMGYPSPGAPTTRQPEPLPSQPKSRIDPNQIPSPVQVQEQDQQLFEGKEYGTCSKTSIPLSSTHVRVVDQGNCNPRFMRVNTTQMPATESLLEQSHLPMALVVQPLAKLRHDEEPIPVVEMQKEGPVRCRRCKGYLNPWCMFIDGGRKFVCNLCGFDSDVPDEYFCNLDMSGRRTDYDYRPELRNGIVEYIVPEDYWAKTPQPLRYLFAIDVSWNSSQSGMLTTFCKTLSDILYDETSSDRLPNGARIGIMTFDNTIHFYNLKAGLEQAQLMVVPDIDDVFVPLNEGLFVDPEESRQVVIELESDRPLLAFANE